MASPLKCYSSSWPTCSLLPGCIAVDLQKNINPIISASGPYKGCMSKGNVVGGWVDLNNACILFEKTPKRIGVSITESHRSGCTDDPEEGVKEAGFFTRNGTPHVEFGGGFPHRQYVISALSFCGREGCVELGRRWHCFVVKIGLGSDEFVCTSLIDMYAKCGEVDSAVRVYDKMTSLDAATCNCLISAYARNGFFVQAFQVFMQIGNMGTRPNHYTYSTMLAVCGTISAIQEGKQLHAHVVKMQYLSETAVGNALLTLYSKCGMMEEAEIVFESLGQRNIISWTASINGFYQHGDFKKALKQFSMMRESGIEPNEFTFSIVLASCGCVKDFIDGRMFHTQVIKKGMASGVFVGTTIIDMYSGLGEMDEAEKQFKLMGRAASNVSWNALIAGYVLNEKIEKAMEAFCRMVKEDVACNEFTYSNIFKACSSFPSLATTVQIHSRLIKSNVESNLHVASSLIEAYTQCGSLENAVQVFTQISDADVVSWNSMIKAYSQNGDPWKAIFLLRKMIEEGNKPTSSTFLTVLSACSHSGLVQEGQEFFKSMVQDYSIQPEETHCSCMVDILGRAGQLENALDFIKKLTMKPTASIWRPLLAACRYNSNLQMAEYVAEKILDLEPNDATVYVTLSNMYAEVGRWADAENQRRLMEQKEISKEPGCSWIEVNNKMYKFFSHDKAHPEMPKVYEKLKQLVRQIQDIRYSPPTTTVLHPESRQPKEQLILYHSEKLAVCFGLLSLPPGKPIRVSKNLRVCLDCHSTMKYISRITDRYIVLKDNYRFHHFKQGCCSCGDYW